jgi:DNA primase
VAPFSVRPLPGASASCPLRWDEVTARLTPTAFTIRNIPERFQAMEDPMLPVLGEGVDMAAAIGRIDRRVKEKQSAAPASAKAASAKPVPPSPRARGKRA